MEQKMKTCNICKKSEMIYTMKKNGDFKKTCEVCLKKLKKYEKKQKTYQKRYYEKNKDIIKNKQKIYYKNNKERIKDINKANYEKNKVEYKEKRDNNKYKWRINNMVFNSKQSDLKKDRYNANHHVDRCFIEQLRFELKDLCVYCSKHMELECSPQSVDLMTLERIDNAFAHSKDNVTLCCRECNSKRGNRYSYKQFENLFKKLEI